MSRPTPGGSRGGHVIVDISEELIATLKKKAVTLRKHIIRMTHNAQSGHPGGSMSAADIVPLEPLAEKWEAFNWHVLTIDGHDFRQILAAIEEAHRTKGRPTAVISRTVKGKGVSFMENKIKYHGAATSDDELKLALAELEAQEAAI